MNALFIIAQLIGFVALFYSLKAYSQESRDKYAKNSILSAVFNIIHYLLLDAYSGVITKVMALVRESIIYKREKDETYKSIFFYIMILTIYILLLFIYYDNSILNLFPIIAAIIYFTVEWFGSVFSIKVVALITTILWIIYNIVVISISGIIYNIIVLITLSIVVINHIKENKQVRK